MSDSLREQLLKAGLVKSEKKQKKRPKNKKQSKKMNRAAESQKNTAKHNPVVEQTKPSTADKAQQKLIRKQIKEKLRANRVNEADAPVAYNFVVGKLIKRIYVTDAQHDLIIKGELAIVPFGEKHYLVPIHLKEELKELDIHIQFLIHNQINNSDEDEFPVPDDLIW